MKINQDFRIGLDNKRTDQKAPNTSNIKFNEIIHKQDKKLVLEQINKLVSEIDNAGERLSRSRTFKDLTKYKNLIKRFIQETVDFGMNLKQSHTWNQFGEGRKLSIVEQIDEHLVDLTENYVKKEKSTIDILDKVGEIKGLILNIYT
ncbi:YaaR family protein [Heyndrickxia vini]|uniref:YaaR family protein n=1 Tax=Heyndrickxia vini TaxID=1476025 RepID=A0ABX7E3T9_9BACI|nr:YaaR family protein [Heyndrickxia vini]QQZ09477.1 YaaR family protein [Heyndrickxia vini]